MPGTQNLPPEAISALVDASAAINSAQGLDETLDAIARAAAAVMTAEGSSVIFLDETRNKQVFRAAVGERAAKLVGLEYDADAGISGKVVRTGEAVIVNDVSKEKTHYKEVDALASIETRSLIAAPLIHQGRKLGVVEVLNPLRRDRFDENDLELCRLFANLAAIATANAEHCDGLQRENCGLKQVLVAPVRMIGRSPPIEKVRELIRRVARSSSTVLLLGETGTGKELAARMIHAESPRSDRAFIPINCAALPETLLESELFGHEAGAFTGADTRKLGQFELAHRGTILLDEMAESSPNIQVKLLRVLENKEINRVGGSRPIACDVRVIAATNRELAEEVEKKQFRSDLYYRLNVFAITLPPLRDRREDVPLLTEHFLKTLAAEMKVPLPTISPEAMDALVRYRFPGNVRELQNILERACLLSVDLEEPDAAPACIRPEHLPVELTDPSAAPAGAPAGPITLAGQEKALIRRALEASGWNQTEAARTLGVSRDNLRYRIKKHGLTRPK